MECREALELLSDEIDGRLAAADAERLAAHVASCADCAAAKRSLASMRAAFRAAPRAKAPPGFADGVMDALPRGRVVSFPKTLGWIVAAAAVVVVAVSLIPNERKSAEKEVAKVQVADAAVPQASEERARGEVAMESGAPAPELAAGAPPAAPARPDVGFVSRDEWDEKKRADGTKNEKAAENEAPVREQPAPPAEPTAGAPAAAPADEARRRNADELAALTRKHFAGEGESVRYVVFRDAAAAELFAASLAPEAASRAKDKAPAPTPAPLPPPTTASPGGGGAGGPAGAGKPPTPTPKPAAKKSGAGETATKLDERQAASADLLKQAAFAPRRVVSRTEALPLGEAELVARVAAAGGVVVPQADAQKFAELLDTAVHAEDDDAGEMKRRAGARGARAPDPAKPGAFEDGKEQAGGGSGALAGGKAAPKVVVVVVVLEPPPPPQPPAATPSNK